MGNNPALMTKFYSSQFKQGSCVLVQGASSGLGREVAKIYASRGCPMVVTARNEAALKELVQECQVQYRNPNVFYICGDAGSDEDCRKIIEFTVQKLSRVDIIVLAAGVSAHERFADMKNLENMRKIMEINFFGYVTMARHALPHLKRAKGQFVVVSSISGVIPLPLRTSYCASKFAVNGFFDALYHEESDDISVTLFCPGTFVGSNFRTNSLSGASPASTSKHVLTLDQTAQLCVAGADRKIRHIRAPQILWFSSFINGIYPRMLDKTIQREAKL